MASINKYIVVFFAGITGIWKGIPVGIGLSLHPLSNGLLTALGSITTAVTLYYSGNSFRQYILKLYGHQRLERKKSRFKKMANKYGPWGLGLLTSGLLGPFTSVVIGLLVLNETRRFLYFLIVGLIVWSIILAYIFTPLYEWISSSFLY